MDLLDGMTCSFCFAVMRGYQERELHQLWHVANGLHAANCAYLKSANDPEGFYAGEIEECDCGLVELRVNLAQEGKI